MALSDLAVYSEYAYSTMTEVLAQQVELFNAASRNMIVLQSAAHQGDYSEEAFFAKISGLVRRRNAYGSGAVSEKVLAMAVDRMVKVAAGTPPVRIDPGQFKWIQMNPEVAGAVIGQQLAVDALADMLNTGVAATAAAISNIAALVNDVSAVTAPGDLPSPGVLVDTAMKFGDQSQSIAGWVMHSAVIGKLYNNALTNANSLFNYGNVNVVQDGFGRMFVISDIPGLVVAGTPNKYRSLGLVPGAIEVHQNNDFTDNIDTDNGDENIIRTYQAEWSFELGIEGYAWDKTNGGKSPTDAALLTATNWDKVVTDNKNTAGVMLVSH